MTKEKGVIDTHAHFKGNLYHVQGHIRFQESLICDKGRSVLRRYGRDWRRLYQPFCHLPEGNKLSDRAPGLHPSPLRRLCPVPVCQYPESDQRPEGSYPRGCDCPGPCLDPYPPPALLLQALCSAPPHHRDHGILLLWKPRNPPMEQPDG